MSEAYHRVATLEANPTLRDDAERRMSWTQLSSTTSMDPVSTRVVQWPKPLEPASFHGIAGEIVRTIEPVSEADPAALLLQFLVAFGNAIGRNAHFLHEDTRHGMNLYAVLVGRTASARKGTSWNRVSRLVTDLDHGWSETRIQSGLSSGEGLVWAVRDDNGKDGAVEDKRLLSVESEFASVLKIMAREGSTLSTTLRQAWDSGMLRTLTKQHAAVATDAHISVLGHITKDELRRYLAETDMANGFGNRFLWVCVKRSKCLPEGGELTSGQRDYIRGRLAPIFAFARQSGELVKDPTARAIWAEVYPDLSECGVGLFGAMTSRGVAQVMRIACIYALLDESRLVSEAHLRAALAFGNFAKTRQGSSSVMPWAIRLPTKYSWRSKSRVTA